MAEDAPIVFTLSLEGEGGKPRRFELKPGADGAIRIGRAPGNDYVVEHRGVSQFHAELRHLPGGPTRLCVRDLSMNGTGLKRDDKAPPLTLTKSGDEPVPDGASLCLPMRLSRKWVQGEGGEVQGQGDRAWLRVAYVSGGTAVASEAAGDDAGGPPAPQARKPRAKSASPAPSPPAKASDNESSEHEDKDTESNRKRFVELLLNTRAVTAGTTYEAAKELLCANPAWSAVSERTRRETFAIFVDHLGSHQSKKKEKKKDKEKGKKGKKEEGKKKKAASDGEGSGSRERSRGRKGARKNGAKKGRGRSVSKSASRSRSRRAGKNRRRRSPSGSR